MDVHAAGRRRRGGHARRRRLHRLGTPARGPDARHPPVPQPRVLGGQRNPRSALLRHGRRHLPPSPVPAVHPRVHAPGGGRRPRSGSARRRARHRRRCPPGRGVRRPNRRGGRDRPGGVGHGGAGRLGRRHLVPSDRYRPAALRPWCRHRHADGDRPHHGDAAPRACRRGLGGERHGPRGRGSARCRDHRQHRRWVVRRRDRASHRPGGRADASHAGGRRNNVGAALDVSRGLGAEGAGWRRLHGRPSSTRWARRSGSASGAPQRQPHSPPGSCLAGPWCRARTAPVSPPPRPWRRRTTDRSSARRTVLDPGHGPGRAAPGRADRTRHTATRRTCRARSEGVCPM